MVCRLQAVDMRLAIGTFEFSINPQSTVCSLYIPVEQGVCREFPRVPETPKILACSRSNHRSSPWNLWNCETTNYLVFGSKNTCSIRQHVSNRKVELLYYKESMHWKTYGDRNTLIEQSAVALTTPIEYLYPHLETTLKNPACAPV